MRPELTEEEYLENERRRRSARPNSPAAPDRVASGVDDDMYRQFRTMKPDDMDYRDYSADQEWVCERCGVDLPPNGRFCAACGYSARAPRISRMASQLDRWFGPEGELYRRYGLTTASMVALAVALFCVLFAVIVQFTIPETSPAYSQADLYQVYAIRSLLWLMGGVVALVTAMVFKRSSRNY